MPAIDSHDIAGSFNLFTPIQVGALEMKNRIFMAPLTRKRAGTSHLPNALMKEYYAQRASAGLIVAECSIIASNTSAFVEEPGVYSEDQLVAWKEITDAVHAKGGKIFIQISHGGRAAHPDNNNGVQCVGPSAIAIDGEVHTQRIKKRHVVPRELSEDEILVIIDQFATAAKNCIQVAGFDGVEIHANGGSLIDQFLRSSSNIRTDQYGGSIENRGRFLAQVLEAVTAVVASDKVGIRCAPLSSYNSMKDEDPLALSEYVAKLAQRFNLAYIHLLRGDSFRLQEGDVEPIFRKHFHKTLISNLGYTKDEANAAIAAGKIDAVAFGTQFIANPDLPERFASNASLNEADPTTFYAGGPKGYIDYPTLA
ncbi:hypothetical protein LEN26_009618 [Aphanomyces euteiches]|nr:hypothetical protein AeMF1_007167 [Aphanomyces euteiches]KAH9125079.1 hypothetical protein LEN26_009618 [Aphanomyces euteiches]KAH9182450.1 hypothetical protein AeNC1_015575 [Aphanomyces euteiches]